MDLNADQFEELVGAYALDACEPEEVAVLDAYVEAHPDVAGDIERLRDAAAALGAVGALHPPLDLRDRLLSRAAECVTAADAQTTLQAETDRLDSFLATLTPTDFAAV